MEDHLIRSPCKRLKLQGILQPCLQNPAMLNCLSGGESRGQPWQNGPLRPIFVPPKKTYQETDEIAWIIEKDRLFLADIGI
jgi:hypothetical protein